MCTDRYQKSVFENVVVVCFCCCRLLLLLLFWLFMGVFGAVFFFWFFFFGFGVVCVCWGGGCIGRAVGGCCFFLSFSFFFSFVVAFLFFLFFFFFFFCLWVWVEEFLIQCSFIAKCQYNCTRNVLWCQVHSSHIHTNHKPSLGYSNSKQTSR